MPTDHTDRRLEERLHAMTDDVDALPLARAADVRARGDQRTRRARAGLAAGSALAVTVAVVGAVTALGRSDVVDVRPAAPEVTVTETVTVTPTPTPSTSVPAGSEADVTVTPVGPGDVPRAAFLPGAGWAVSGLSGGAPVQLAAVESEGSVQYADCDVDAEWTGRAGVLQAVERAGTQVGVQKVRLLGSAQRATQQVATQVAGLTACAKQVGRDGTATVTPVPSAAVRDATGSVDVVHTVVDRGSPSDQWVVVAREGRAVSTLTVPVFDRAPTVAQLQQLAAAARARLAAALR